MVHLPAGFEAYQKAFKDVSGWWATSGWFLSHVAFTAKLDLLQIDSGGIGAGKSVEGGIGLALRLSQSFYLGVTVDRVAGRALRNDIVPGKVYTDSEGKPLDTISKNDDRFFVNDSAVAMSFGLCFVK